MEEEEKDFGCNCLKLVMVFWVTEVHKPDPVHDPVQAQKPGHGPGNYKMNSPTPNLTNFSVLHLFTRH